MNQNPVENILEGLNKGPHYININEKSSRQYNIFIDTDIGPPSDYRELVSILFSADEDDQIMIFINSGGGHFDTAMAIVEGLKSTHAKVTAILIGACHSAASVISMYCHDVVVLDSAYSMVHTATFGSVGNVSNVKSHTEFTIKQLEKVLMDTYEGFLSKEELLKIKSGSELWFNAEEIRSRIASRVKFVEAKNKKKAKETE